MARRASAPASSANLGPGFDVLGLALGLRVVVEARPAPACSIAASGEGGDLPAGADHLAARVARAVLGHDRVAFVIHSEIPVARGLGSSAALAVATAAALGAVAPLEVAARLEGHPDNAAAATFGGLVAATTVDDRVVAAPLPLDAELAAVVLVPDAPLETARARAVLPTALAREEVVAQLGRLGLLLAGLADRHRLRPEAGRDWLHQPARSTLFPAAPRLIEALVDAGAAVATWSGAGSSILGLTTRSALGDLRAAGAAALAREGVPGRALALDIDRRGLEVVAL